MCISCKRLLPRSDLIRILISYKTKKAYLQPSAKLQGRSFYICYNKICLQTSLKKAKIQKILGNSLNNEIIELLQLISK